MLLNRSDPEPMDEAYPRRLNPEQLLAVGERLLQDVKELHERLNQNVRNISVPPSRQPAYLESGAPAPGEESDEQTPVDRKLKPGEGKEDGEAEASPAREPARQAKRREGSAKPGKGEERRAGKPVGAPGYGRTQILPPRGPCAIG